jgi:hypothetical protein
VVVVLTPGRLMPKAGTVHSIAEGVEGLRDRPRSGRPCALDEGHQATLKALILKGPKLARDGCVAWRLRDLCGLVDVSDMGKAESWARPGEDNWIDAKAAVYVIESRLAGGMGAPEAVPFGTPAAAEAFVRERGGRVVALDGIPDAYVLGNPIAPPTHEHGDAS